MSNSKTLHISPKFFSVTAKGFSLPAFEALLYTGAGLAALLMGSWAPDVRLTFSGVPLNTVLLALFLILVTTTSIRKQVLVNLVLVQSPLILLGFTVLWSPDPVYGLDKISALLVTGNITLLLFSHVAEHYGVRHLVRIILLFLSILLALTFVYKLRFGFFDRGVPFFLNGPIVFGRLMMIAAVLVYFAFDSKWKFLPIAIFFLAVIWTESKGPVLAIIASISIVSFVESTPKKRVFTFLFVILLAAFVVYWSQTLLDLRFLGRYAVMFDLAAGNFDAINATNNQGSIGSRTEAWLFSLEYLTYHPLGTGLGGYKYASTVEAVGSFSPGIYPHNLFCELWVEGGVLIGTLALIPLLAFFVVKLNVFSYVAFSFFLAQQVSGDLADARLLLIFSMLAIFSHKEKTVNG